MYLAVNQCFNLSGNAILPGSKSQTIRGLVFALLAKGESTLLNVLDSDDTQTAMRVCRALGARLNLTEKGFTVDSDGLPLMNVLSEIDTGNSGITTRFILPLLGLRENDMTPILVKCGEQMQARPIKPLVDALRDLGMHIQYVEQAGRLPLLVSGRLQGGETEVDGTTSQYISALLIGLPTAEKDSVITVKDLHERPYVNMTLAWLKDRGISYSHEQNGKIDRFYIPGKQCYTPFHTTIKGDFSSASCLLAAAALLPGEVVLHGLDSEDTQGDKRLISILQEMGADIVSEKDNIRIKNHSQLTGCRIDANDIPDLVPALAVIATQAAGKTEIYNVKQARIKETDRIHSMTEGLRKMGASIEEYEDGMTVHRSDLHGSFVNGYGDHRTVMALTIAGLLAPGTTLISDGEAITKTYPEFVTTMQALGAKLAFDQRLVENHIILMGFKHVGKTLIGSRLASLLNKTFIDLDKEIERFYQKNNSQSYSCRQIMLAHGESYFRELEEVVLQHILQLPACVIALGGGTPLSPANQMAIQSHVLLHVVAPRGVVFERIMVEGRPAFFGQQEDAYAAFSRLWEERSVVYTNLTSRQLDNSGTVEQAVHHAIRCLSI